MTTTKDKLRIVNMKRGRIILPTKSETKQQQKKDNRRKEANRILKQKKKQQQKKRNKTKREKEDNKLLNCVIKNLNLKVGI